MAFGETVGSETLDLLEAPLGEVALISALEHAVDELVPKAADAAGPLEGGHGTPEAVGLAGREAGGDDGDLHRLLLEQRDAVGLLEHVLEFGRRIRSRFQTLPAFQIRVDHIALDRTGANDGDFDDEVVEFRRLEPGQHRHLRPAFDLEDADGVGAMGHLVDPLVLLRHRR